MIKSHFMKRPGTGKNNEMVFYFYLKLKKGCITFGCLILIKVSYTFFLE
ncbi:hypothetical protein B4135_3453 [Caldibacillus debilis]|uniref:Uncharacterized protein n=1 Tax=Caldibacillus debilis TaxID=301148 RepID=A0A150LD68_9BACI|nr:hypothetical protein B4135_3453 [Caldibacillus debilis]